MRDGSQSSSVPSLPRLLEASAEDILHGLHNKHFKIVDLVTAYLSRIEEVNDSLHIVAEVNPDVLVDATQLDVEMEAGCVRSPLHGLPVLLKSNMATLDRMQTDAGSLALQGARVSADCTVAAKLRKQGLLILGKTSMSEWCMHRSSNPAHAWSPVSGQIYGAYLDKQCPGGSSGGAAVATDLGLAWAALGSDTGGSVIGPAGRNNVVGLRPTVGLTSRHLVVPLSERQDTIGPIARSVKDVARLLQVIAGPDINDTRTLTAPNRTQEPNYLAACKAGSLRGRRIGIPRNVIQAPGRDTTYVQGDFERAVDLLSAVGAIIVDNIEFAAWERLKSRTCNPILNADFAHSLSKYLKQLVENPNNISDLVDLRHFVRNTAAEENATRNTDMWDQAIEANMLIDSVDFEQAYRENVSIGGENGLLGALERHSLDAVVLPTILSFTIPALVGCPVISVPLGSASQQTPLVQESPWDTFEIGPGLPTGISFMGRPWSEELLLGMAFDYEQLSHVRPKLSRFIQPTRDLIDTITDQKIRIKTRGP